MWKAKLCISCSDSFEMPAAEQIQMFADVGFDGFFVGWNRKTDMQAIRRQADSLGLLWQSVHAPFYGTASAAAMWSGGEAGEAAVRELTDCIRASAEVQVPLVICHAFIGFKDHTPTMVGLENYSRVVLEAARLGVKIAFENTEGEEYLAALMDHFRSERHVGFCWDTGHEICYNGAKDWLALYGERLLGTHLNDNLGVRDYCGETTPKDDLHLLPFEGIADWHDIAARLAKCGFDGPLTFELKRNGRLGTLDADFYGNLSTKQYICEAYKRACRVAALVQRAAGIFGGRA